MRIKLNPLEKSVIRMALRNYEAKMDRWTAEDSDLENKAVWQDNAALARKLITQLGGELNSPGGHHYDTPTGN